MARAAAVDVLLGLAVLVVLACSAGVLLMRDAYQKLHYVTPVSMVAPVLAGLAVLVQSGWTAASGQAWLVVAIMLITSPFLAHATVRAIWISENGSRGQGTGRQGTAGQEIAGPARSRERQ